MAGVVGLPVKAFLVERPHGERRGLPEKASLEPVDSGGHRLLLKLPGGEEWWVERETLDFILRSVDDHLEHIRRYP
jgi:hypothetical protein